MSAFLVSDLLLGNAMPRGQLLQRVSACYRCAICRCISTAAGSVDRVVAHRMFHRAGHRAPRASSRHHGPSLMFCWTASISMSPDKMHHLVLT